MFLRHWNVYGGVPPAARIWRTNPPPSRITADAGWAAIASGTSTATDGDLALLGPRIETELLKDVRNAEVRATVRVTSAGQTGTTFDVDIEIVTDTNELIKLGLAADSDGVRRTA